MTTLESTTDTMAPLTRTGTSIDELQLVTFDLYRDIHKGIRSELFAVTTAAGLLDPGDAVGWVALVDHVDAVERTLVTHAHHEDTYIDPALCRHLPHLAAHVAADHAALEATFGNIVRLTRAGAAAPGFDQRRLAHSTYLELASFTSAYLAHQSMEETEIMPALEQSLGVEAVIAIHTAIIDSIPPDEMALSLTMMLPAMNLEDRLELLGGMRAQAPAGAFEAVVGLARSVLTPADFAALAARLGLR